MTKEQFIDDYCEAKELTGFDRDRFLSRHVVMECTCDDGPEEIPHWAMIGSDPETVAAHLDHEAVLAELRAD